MHMRLTRGPFTVLAIAALGLPLLAASTRFTDITPLTGSATGIPVGAAGEATPITLASSRFSQRTLADRATQNMLVPGSNSGSFDMITSNETGANAGRYLFMPFETDTAGVQRIDLNDSNYMTRTVTIVAPGTKGFVSGDASRWAPWGGYLTAEESWDTNPDDPTDPDDHEHEQGRLFEVTNPITAGPNGGSFIWRNILPRVSHEGLAFDRDNALYFVDELNGGSLYKYVSANPKAATGAEFFTAGQTFVLKVDAGGQFEGNNGPAITGTGFWVPITDPTGAALAGVSAVNVDGTIDGRASADAVAATGYNRPEDIEIQTLPNGTQLLYFNTTDSDDNANTSDGRSRTYTLNLSTNRVALFADSHSTDLATGNEVGGGFRNADNLARDAAGNMYIVEDRAGGVDDDIWLAVDLNQDGDIDDAGEGLARWVSNGTQGSEFTGLYFDLRDQNTAYVNIQHPTSGVDRTIEISAGPKLQKK